MADVGRDLDDFRRFVLLSMFRLRLYKVAEQGKTAYCVGLLVRYEDPDGWIAVWRRCYDSLEKALELYSVVEPLARNRLRDLIIVEAITTEHQSASD
jgi:hypothetical protein